MKNELYYLYLEHKEIIDKLNKYNIVKFAELERLDVFKRYYELVVFDKLPIMEAYKKLSDEFCKSEFTIRNIIYKQIRCIN